MCGRFASSTPIAALAEQFLVAEIEADERDASYNVAPTDDVYAVVARHGSRRLGSLSWGLLPSWSEDASPSRRMINLRAETVRGKGSFRRLLERRRCAVPADGFYEWKQMGRGRPKQPFFITGRDRRPLALAGLWAAWRDPAGEEAGVGAPAGEKSHGAGRGWGPRLGEEAGVGAPAGEKSQDGEKTWLRTCTIITTEPNGLVAPLHDRMPVILAEEAWDMWLDEEQTDTDLLGSLLVPYPSELLEMWPVGPDVNSVANDGPRLVKPLEGHEPS
ncbi:MAG TPA: SOS response-associated peptidase [Acidimicrobiales bacterium]|nr:SOS response-associated peptidase [Acidimicrobiales bacterium]